MSWGDWFLALMMCECAIAALMYFIQGDLPYCIAFIGWTVANFGIWLNHQ